MRISDWSSDVCSSDLKKRGGALASVAPGASIRKCLCSGRLVERLLVVGEFHLVAIIVFLRIAEEIGMGLKPFRRLDAVEAHHVGQPGRGLFADLCLDDAATVAQQRAGVSEFGFLRVLVPAAQNRTTDIDERFEHDVLLYAAEETGRAHV